MDKYIISSYTNSNILAHKLKGNISEYGLNYIDLDDKLDKDILKNLSKLLNKKYYNTKIKIKNVNPSFLIKHPKLNLIYNCMESIYDGYIETYEFEINNFNNYKFIK